MNDEAKIIGITLAIAGLIGMCVFCAPTIFLPTTFFEYWTGILLSANCTNTTPVTNNRTPNTINNANINPFVSKAPSLTTNPAIDVIACGILETIPAKINIDVPFPIPLDVILSPTHISSEVPATSDKITTAIVWNPVPIKIPFIWYEK